jgi:hypothetical protein
VLALVLVHYQEHPVNTNSTADLSTIVDDDLLVSVSGGLHIPSWNDVLNVGKAAANGGANTLNFFHDHPIELGKLGEFKVGGDRVTKPFTNDPLSHVGNVEGHPVPAPA